MPAPAWRLVDIGQTAKISSVTCFCCSASWRSNCFCLLGDRSIDMASKSKKAKVNTEENEVLQTQIDISVNLARDLVHSWLPAAQPGEESDNDDDDITSYSQGRPGR